MTDAITITAPDDWHIHLRDDNVLPFTVPDAARQFRRAIIMPNLSPPVLNADQAMAYKRRIEAQIPNGCQFEPLMVLYLTDNTTPADIAAAKSAGVVACKLYPAGATTNSASGVTDIAKLMPVFQAMAEHGVLLLIHGEVTDAEVDIFDREAVFIDRILSSLIKKVPHLKIVLEHITTADAVQFVKDADSNVAATITAHHLLYNRNHMLAGGIRPHYYCLPILKRSRHQQALLEAATSGNAKFFLGTDSAPHAREQKVSACGCAGAYTAYAAMELYAEAFEQMNSLPKLEAFASHFGPDFYGMPRNQSQITLRKEAWTAPDTLPFGPSELVPLGAGSTLHWRLQTN